MKFEKQITFTPAEVVTVTIALGSMRQGELREELKELIAMSEGGSRANSSAEIELEVLKAVKRDDPHTFKVYHKVLGYAKCIKATGLGWEV